MDPSRPRDLQKQATDQPPSVSPRSLLDWNRRVTAGRPPQLGRQATLTFDPFSFESSPSSNEEEGPSSDGHGTRSRERHDQGEKRKSSPQSFSRFRIANEHFSTRGKISKLDGRLKLSINETVNSGYFAKTLGAGLRKHIRSGEDGESAKSPLPGHDAETEKIPPEDDKMENGSKQRVKLNVCVIVIGSRGDIQPFLKIGKILKDDYGHRVRIATHPAFKKFVEEDSGLEFFSVGGDPSELMAFMVKNPGLIPSVDTIKDGEIGRRRAAMYDMFQGMWRACINSTDDENDKANMKMMGDKHPFVADAIIANPPSFAPQHIAERLGVPLHMIFPYTPTAQFPHPLANIKASNVDANYTNFMSYPLVEMMTWQGLGDLINRFRSKTLCLEEISTLWAPGQLYRLKVPYTYMWSPSLVSKPKDWGPEIDIAGFVFLELASSFKPPESLIKFLDDGPPPLYIGFGSIVVDDPDKFTKLIFEAVEMAGARALVSKGWGGLGDEGNTPDNIYMLENTPHDWLFPRVSAVVHHGGAGTTAIGLKCGKPTMIIPFFGDQPFWGAMVAKAKAGAHNCIPYKKLTAERLAEGIKQCLTNEAKENVQKIADSIAKEGDGAANAVRSFHRSLPLHGDYSMRCQILENRVATWKLKNTDLRLCSLAAELLVEWKKIKWNDLRLLRHYEWNDFGGPGEPITGGWGAIMGTASDVATGVGLIPFKMAKSVKKREEYYQKRYRISKGQRHAKQTLAQANTDFPNERRNSNWKDSNSRSDRPGKPDRRDTNQRTLSKLPRPEDYLAQELAQEAGHGLLKTGGAIIRAPMEFTLAITQGFHNAPRLYGDETVRRPPRVTGFHSGFRAGRDEFVYGIRDGVAGLWMQPYCGARDGGMMGFLHGFGMGIGGVVLKDIAAFLGPPAYVMKGLHEEALKKYQPTNFLRRARVIQGQNELAALGPRHPHHKSGDSNDEKKEEGMERQEVEIAVTRGWEVVQSQMLADKRKHTIGLRASLLGRKVRKGGEPFPRKSSKADVSVKPKSASPQ
ncbi:UDP-Glycosyltransferase/glycogen phosphorylase [Lindgomyces ingoldianus]|uniref:UDP-Glycosyltransferase/glycogen phosphorylase n=1 Tax=Lindgomyces ingoldianus TaxID=673940 RepID=A0ACB6RE96_9PLEO|nr:UDP-Glycosyltransferase/glycogen phosphorylase [Lindgomyces ingoldianus]KAF2477040.1 UDP-Glycosyltransferase/glycogen phosphorylase [Lindgomyces ingoldianus]